MTITNDRSKELVYIIHRSDALGVCFVGWGLIWDALGVPNQDLQLIISVCKGFAGRNCPFPDNVIKDFSEREFRICAQNFFGFIPDFAGRIFYKLAGFCNNKTYFYGGGPVFGEDKENYSFGFNVDCGSALIIYGA